MGPTSLEKEEGVRSSEWSIGPDSLLVSLNNPLKCGSYKTANFGLCPSVSEVIYSIMIGPNPVYPMQPFFGRFILASRPVYVRLI